MTFSSQTAVLTTHFGDLRWVRLLVSRLRAAFPEIPARNLYVIDQDRTDASRAALRREFEEAQILQLPKSDPHFVITGHDHAHVLNLAARQIPSEFLFVFDSDAHPIGTKSSELLARLLRTSDAVLAARWETGTATHPCFMAFGPAVDRERLFFDEGQVERGVDTGRMIYDQVVGMELAAELLRPQPAFGGRWGTLYLDGTIYHHGSGSFHVATDQRLQAQAKRWRREHEFFKRRVLAGQYELSRREAAVARLLAVRREAFERAHLAARAHLGPRIRKFGKRLLVRD